MKCKLLLIGILLVTSQLYSKEPTVKPTLPQKIPYSILNDSHPLSVELTELFSSNVLDTLRSYSSEEIDSHIVEKVLDEHGLRVVGNILPDDILMWHRENPNVLIGYGKEQISNKVLDIRTGAIRKQLYHIPKTPRELTADNYMAIYSIPFPKPESTIGYKIITGTAISAALIAAGIIWAKRDEPDRHRAVVDLIAQAIRSYEERNPIPEQGEG